MERPAMSERIELWWRDDDAVTGTPSLQKLIDLRRKWDVPLALAVVPANAAASLFSAICSEQDIDILVHGFAHINHAPPGERRSELGPYRPRAEIEQELKQGLARLQELHPQTLPVLVPPWNNREPALLEALPTLGYTGVSGWNARNKLRAVPGLAAACTHIDLFHWRDGGRLKSLEEMITSVETEIARQSKEGSEPIGILTHHLQMNNDAFARADTLFSWLSADTRFFWSQARNIFAAKGAHS
jgi:hypothetical protein